ncbi:FAD-dependent monooxygenase [Nocardioides carbamazepini]|uniref:FAD-dependent monooxygenase n=1 Tax=Nocardioides carbamazepini TaxID=2854259 RepID=UPI00214A04BF|nr:FAD-dependent monooxygenase [Nocardioides carbamazepini]MCR1782650.1 FAD-dependent monooxygenase [Nocardioides carbamazepini]
MSDGPELVIAGAGISGLALAAGLAHAGTPLRVRLLDERPGLGSSGGAITLWPAALAALDRIGVGTEVRAAGHPVGAGTIRSRTGRTLRSLDPARTAAALGESPLAVRRGPLIELLHARIAPGRVAFDSAVHSYERIDGGVRVRTSHGTLDARALVGADGYRSQVARTLHPGLGERYAGYPAWRGLTRVPGLEAVQLWGARQEFGVVPLGDGLAYWFATVREPAEGAAVDELAHLAEAFRGWPEPVARVLAGTDPQAVGRNDVMDRQPLRRWHDGPVVVIGDAAHPMRPHLGQGGCQALVDAALLASLLADGSLEDAFAAFEARRRRTTRRVVVASRAAARAVEAPAAVHRLSALVPDAVLLRALGAISGRRD